MRAAACLFVLIGLAAGRAVAQNPSDQPVTLDTLGSDLQPLAGEDQHELSITGFGVAGYTLDGKTHDNSLGAGKIAVALFRELTDNLYVFGQLTTSISDEAEAGEEPATEIEIDNLLVSFTPKSLSSLNLTFGTLDAPIGFERDDEVLLLTPTTSFNFELARPSKLTGLFATYALSRKADLTGFVTNGWDSPVDPNHGKTVGGRLGFLPTERSSLGFSTLYGSEGDVGESNDRLLLNADYVFQPTRDWLLAGEANYGKDIDLPDDGGNASWTGATVLAHHRLDRHWGLVARAEVLDDKDGARTGQAQTLTSYAIGPIYSIGVGREGIFANITHTTYRVPRFQLRGEVRLNHSNVPFFETDDGLSQSGVQYTLQLVTTF